jgi:hypothetical protein
LESERADALMTVVNLRHSASRVHRGIRFTLGIIFHDAK